VCAVFSCMQDGQLARPHILVVEDEVLIRAFMRDVLEEVGFSVREAANAGEALELMKSEEFSVLVSNIEMAGAGTTLDLAWTVERKWPRTGLVLICGRHLPTPAAMPAKVKFVAKPWQMETLLQAVREVLTQ
jgi:DNA-binding NtrC family response regulator